MESMLGSRRRSKKEIPILYWWLRNNYLFPSSSRTFRTQSYWSFNAGQCCDSEQLLPVNIPCRMCFQFAFYHRLWINTWRSEFKQETDSILLAYWSQRQRASRSCKDWLECTTSCTILAQCLEETSRRGILGWYWSCNSKRIDIEPSEQSLSAYEVSKKVVNLLRHCLTVQREDDGAVQFWRIKFYLRNHFPQNQYWSDDRW